MITLRVKGIEDDALIVEVVELARDYVRLRFCECG